MKTFNRQLGTVDITDDRLEEYLEEINKQDSSNSCVGIEDVFDVFLEFIILAMETKNFPKPKSMRILEAHGNNTNGYEFGENVNGQWNMSSIPEWIKKHEKDFDVLYITPCNPNHGATIKRGKSYIIYPKSFNHSMNIAYLASSINSDLIILPPKKLFWIYRLFS
ncbi:hypothetical protein HY837_03090 [archaeon]|nr:hypothetical protein [archaeon]